MKKFKDEKVQEILGYKFNNPTLLETAFTHASYANENFTESYQRLEFLGDAVLNYVIARLLFKKFPDEKEGFLSKTRARIVAKDTLSRAISQSGLINYLLVGLGETKKDVTESDAVKCDLFESIVGAISRDSKGLKDVSDFICRLLSPFIKEALCAEGRKDYKSELLEKIAIENKHQEKKKKVVFKQIGKVGKDHQPMFSVFVTIDGREYGLGVAGSIKRAEQNAAKETLEILFSESQKANGRLASKL